MLVVLAGITLAGAGSKQAALQRIAAAVQVWLSATCSNAPLLYDVPCHSAGGGRQLAGGDCYEAGHPGAPPSEAAEMGRPWASWLPSPPHGVTYKAAVDRVSKFPD